MCYPILVYFNSDSVFFIFRNSSLSCASAPQQILKLTNFIFYSKESENIFLTLAQRIAFEVIIFRRTTKIVFSCSKLTKKWTWSLWEIIRTWGTGVGVKRRCRNRISRLMVTPLHLERDGGVSVSPRGRASQLASQFRDQLPPYVNVILYEAARGPSLKPTKYPDIRYRETPAPALQNWPLGPWPIPPGECFLRAYVGHHNFNTLLAAVTDSSSSLCVFTCIRHTRIDHEQT